MSRLRRFFLVFVCFGYLRVDYFCVLQSNYMSSLRRFFLVFVCFVKKSNIEQGDDGRRTNSIGYFRYERYTAYYKVYSFRFIIIIIIILLLLLVMTINNRVKRPGPAMSDFEMSSNDS